jgi:hypothetical protein
MCAGKISLDALLSRADMVFTTAFRFQGNLRLVVLSESFQAITREIGKFNMRLNFQAQNSFVWVPFEGHRPTFHVVDANDSVDCVRELSSLAFQIRSDSNKAPINMLVLRSTEALSKEPIYTIVIQCSHEYIDARSSETLFQLIVDHYNGSVIGDAAVTSRAIEFARRLRTSSADELIRLAAAPGYNFAANLKEMESYPTLDNGGYIIRREHFPELIPKLAERKRMPTGFFVDSNAMVARCRAVNPKISRGAILTAVLHKALYNINVQHKGLPDKHLICGRVVSDILSPQLRQHFIGNFFAFVPVAAPGELPVEYIAKLIHDRIVEIKRRQLDLTCFQIVEFAANHDLFGTAEMEYSYSITNWVNHHFLSTRNLIAGCESLAHMSVANYYPKDEVGAMMVNRVFAGSNLSFDGLAYMSMLQSLRDDSENELIENEIKHLFLQAARG